VIFLSLWTGFNFGICIIISYCSNAGEADVGKGEKSAAAAMAGGLVGQPKEVHSAENSVEFEDLGKFAVQEHNSKEVSSCLSANAVILRISANVTWSFWFAHFPVVFNINPFEVEDLL
jgi:hypothetical protein